MPFLAWKKCFECTVSIGEFERVGLQMIREKCIVLRQASLLLQQGNEENSCLEPMDSEVGVKFNIALVNSSLLREEIVKASMHLNLISEIIVL